jgi:hypothetical protein
MTLKKLGLVTLTAAAAALFVLGTTGASEAAKKKAAPKVSPICMTEAKPVCATKGGKRFTYVNACYAGNDGATVVSKKACPAPKAKKGGGKKKAAKKGAKKK